jgi:hypothetical protein
MNNPIEELIDFIIGNEGKIDLNDVLIKAELINMRSKPRHAGWYFNGQLFQSLDELKGRTMSENNKPKQLFYYP